MEFRLEIMLSCLLIFLSVEGNRENNKIKTSVSEYLPFEYAGETTCGGRLRGLLFPTAWEERDACGSLRSGKRVHPHTFFGSQSVPAEAHSRPSNSLLAWHVLAKHIVPSAALQ